jgi:flagellar motor protein MotB
VKGFFSSLGWLLFLLTAAGSLIFYNFVYLPAQSRIIRMEREIQMWTGRVDELSDSLKMLSTGADTLFSVSYRFDELFTSAESLKLSATGESILRKILPQLASGPVVEVIGSCERRPPASARWQSSWEFSAFAAATVARWLISLGVPAAKVRVVSLGDRLFTGRPEGPDAQLLNRRIQIVVRAR